MSEFDLNIENYKLDDILKLFKMEINFTLDDLKKAKKIALMTHPDKSKYPKEIFLFYSKAYKKLYGIYQFRNKTGDNNFDKDYKDIVEEYKVVKDVNKDEKENTKKFNKWFNKTFEELVHKPDDGYSDWLKNETNEIHDKLNSVNSKSEKEKILMDTKKQSRELTIYKEREELNASFSGNITSLSSKVDNFGNSELFSKNPYDDIKNAYENTLIPVTDDDFNIKKKYNNIFEMQTDRKNNEVVMNDSLKKQQESYLL